MSTLDLVVTLESIPLGEPWSAALGAAEASLAEDRAAAEAAMFPADLVPTSADALAAYTFQTSRLSAAGYGDRMAELHRRAMVTHPALAELLRSSDALDDVGAAAASLATPNAHETHAAAGARAAEAARARCRLAIAHQLAEVPGHKLGDAARALIGAEAIEARIAAVKAKHEAHVAAELERAEAERRAAARAVVDRTVERVRAAERAAEDARARAELSAQEYRAARVDALVERIRLAGVSDIRVGHGDSRKVYGAADVIATAPQMTAEQIAYFESALNAMESP